jgi:hypothetical protein
MFSARPSLDALAAPTVAAFWLAPHFGQNAADPTSEPQALQNAIETPPRRSVARRVTKDLFRRNSYCSRVLPARASTLKCCESLLDTGRHGAAHPVVVMAEFDRALIQERVRAGLHNAKAKGRQAICARYRIVAQGEKVSALLRMQQNPSRRRDVSYLCHPSPSSGNTYARFEQKRRKPISGSLLTCFLRVRWLRRQATARTIRPAIQNGTNSDFSVAEMDSRRLRIAFGWATTRELSHGRCGAALRRFIDSRMATS